MRYRDQTKEELLERGIPNFFSNWGYDMSSSRDLGLYAALGREFPASENFEPVFIIAASGNPYTARDAGGLVKALALSLWFDRRAEVDDIVNGLMSIDPELANVVHDNYIVAKRRQGRREIEASALKVRKPGSRN